MTTTQKTDFAAQLAMFLQEKTGSVWGTCRARLTAQEQRALFGRFLGKGTIVINGTEETVAMSRKVCFGLDSEIVNTTKWAQL